MGRAYDEPGYRRKRAANRTHPEPCWRSCGRWGVTLGHVPPLDRHDHRPGSGCCVELPECGPCNYGEGGRITAANKRARRLAQSRRW